MRNMIFNVTNKHFLFKYRNSFNFCLKPILEPIKNEEIAEIKNIKEFKEGFSCMIEGKFNEAELKFKECLGYLKNSNSSETLGYNMILRKLIHSLIKSRKYEESEKLLNASLLLSERFTSYPELIFNSHRNLLAFYTHTNISKATDYVESLLKNDRFDTHTKKYFVYAAGPIYLLNNDYKNAKKYIDQSLSIELPDKYVGFTLHNLGVLTNEKKRHFDILPSEIKEKWSLDNDYKENSDHDKEFLIYNKQALYLLESKGREGNQTKILSEFLKSEEIIPKKMTENFEIDLIKSFESGISGLTISNIAEYFFEKDMRSETAFWLKLGLKYYDKHEPNNIARHLILFALFYSQLGQTLMAEGLYRRSLSLMTKEYDFNVVFGMNMYGRLLLRQEKRHNEANELLEKSENIASTLPHWYNRLCKIRYLDFDFE